jgi:hypothetical protein
VREEEKMTAAQGYFFFYQKTLDDLRSKLEEEKSFGFVF